MLYRSPKYDLGFSSLARPFPVAAVVRRAPWKLYRTEAGHRPQHFSQSQVIVISLRPKQPIPHNSILVQICGAKEVVKARCPLSFTGLLIPITSEDLKGKLSAILGY